MLWIGPRLSVMEQLAVCSFLRNGHTVHLYVYEPTENVPAGTTLLDAAEILPAARIFKYRETGSYAGFANHFRYKLLLEKGGWYVDADTVCLEPFDFPSPYVFASEDAETAPVVTAGMIKAPRASRVMRRAWRTCDRADPATLRWGDTGTKLLAHELRKCSLEGYVQEPAVFCPLPYPDWARVLDPSAPPEFARGAHAIHLWQEMWRRSGQDKDASYDPDCLYEELKRRYL